MNARWRYSLLAKMLGWLALHLLLLALISVAFVSFQFSMGLDSLLTGGTGERLRELGEIMGRDFRAANRSEWSGILQHHATNRGVAMDLWRPGDRWQVGQFSKVPENVLDRLHQIRPGPPLRQAAPPPREDRPPPEDGRPPREDGPPPRRDPDFGPPDDFDDGPPPFRDQPPDRTDSPLPSSSGVRPGIARPLFLVRGEDGDGYWAAVDLPLMTVRPGEPAKLDVLLIRSDDLSAKGLLFEVRPWIMGGLAVLVFSVIFWTPFAFGITRYVGRLTRATERIAEGNFQVDVGTTRRDELGRLGTGITEMAGRLDRFVSGQRRFLADVAHELCAPLARLRTGIAVLEPVVPVELQPRLFGVEEDSDELARLIEEILAFSRAGAGRPQLRDCDLDAVLCQVVSREAGDLKVRLEVPAGLRVHADLGLLSRAFGNLVRNTRIHAGATAELTITVQSMEEGILVTFRDNGPGVPVEELGKLFEPFYRPDRSRTRDTGGTGLGLAIVRSCVEACGGRVQAAAPSEGGFEVTVSLPPHVA